MKAVRDTNLLLAESLSHPGYRVAASSLSWAEFGYGIRKAADPVERARREGRAARLRSLLGAGLPFDDAAADAHGAVVLTRDVQDFTGLAGLVTVVGV